LILVAAAAVLVLGGIAVAAFLAGGDDSDIMHVSFFLTDPENIGGTNGDCGGGGGYDDFQPGMNVRVTDENGRTVGSGNLVGLNDAPEYFEEPFGDVDLDDDVEGACTLVADVEVSPSEFYTVEAGGRGELTYTHDELDERDWEVVLTLGD
jgi:hypothetical protein